MMTRKDFEALAASVRAVDALDPEARLRLARTLAYTLADLCAKSNPRFDRARFLTACGVSQ